MGDLVRLEIDKESGVGTIRLDRPPMNAINPDVVAQLEEAAREATINPEVKAVVLYGGDKIFAAGADIKDMAERAPQDMMMGWGGLQETFNQVEDIPKVTVAAITGYALGGGCELAMCADFRVAGENAAVGQPEILLGIIPGAGGTQRLPRLVGPAKAKDIIYSGRFVKAEEALRIGLVDEVVAPDKVYERAVEIAARYAKGPLFALRAAKVAVNRGSVLDLRSGLTIEREVFVSLFATEDQKIGMRSFVEKGPGKAEFAGR